MAKELDVNSLALAGGTFWGAALFIFTLIGMLVPGYGTEFYQLMSFYPFYEVSIAGAFVGLVLGFIDGFVGLYIFGWLYNWFLKR